MIIGIVGNEKAKFTLRGRALAIGLLYKIINRKEVDAVVSGKCPLGGIDIWAIDVARELGKRVIEYAPLAQSWEMGFKPRNIRIAVRSDELHCIVVDVLPRKYRGRRFQFCYHCGPDSETHIKSGGCWTMNYAAKLRRKTQLHIIHNDPFAAH